MQIQIGGHCIETGSFASKDQLATALATCPDGSLMLGENSEQQAGFHFAHIVVKCSSRRGFGVGVCSEGHGLTPKVLIWPEAGSLLVGFNSEVVAIQIPSFT